MQGTDLDGSSLEASIDSQLGLDDVPVVPPRVHYPRSRTRRIASRRQSARPQLAAETSIADSTTQQVPGPHRTSQEHEEVHPISEPEEVDVDVENIRAGTSAHT